MSSWDEQWSPETLHGFGFDGWVHLDLGLPPWLLMQQVETLITTRPLIAPRVPEVRREPSNLPNETDITKGDQVNLNILTLLSFGLSDKDIASALCLAPHTIRNRVSRMLGNGGFESRTALALHFIRMHRLKMQRYGLEVGFTVVAPSSDATTTIVKKV